MKCMKMLVLLSTLIMISHDLLGVKPVKVDVSSIQQDEVGEISKSFAFQDHGLELRINDLERQVLFSGATSGTILTRTYSLENGTGVNESYVGTPLVDCCSINNQLIGNGSLYKTIIFQSDVKHTTNQFEVITANNFLVHATSTDKAVIDPEGAIIGMSSALYPNTLLLNSSNGNPETVIKANVVIQGDIAIVSGALHIEGDLIIQGSVTISSGATLQVKGNCICDGLSEADKQFENYGSIIISGNLQQDGNFIIRNYNMPQVNNEAVFIDGNITVSGSMIFKNNKGSNGVDGDTTGTDGTAGKSAIYIAAAQNSSNPYVSVGSSLYFVNNEGGWGGNGGSIDFGSGDGGNGGNGGNAIYIDGTVSEVPTLIQVGQDIIFIKNKGGAGGNSGFGNGSGMDGDGGNGSSSVTIVGNGATITGGSILDVTSDLEPGAVLQAVKGNILYSENEGGLGGQGGILTFDGSGGHAVHMLILGTDTVALIQAVSGDVSFIKNIGGSSVQGTEGGTGGHAVYINFSELVLSLKNVASIEAMESMYYISNVGGNGDDQSGSAIKSNENGRFVRLMWSGNDLSFMYNRGGMVLTSGSHDSVIELTSLIASMQGSIIFNGNIGSKGIAGKVVDGGAAITLRGASLNASNIMFANNIGGNGADSGSGGVAIIIQDLNGKNANLSTIKDAWFIYNAGGAGGSNGGNGAQAIEIEGSSSFSSGRDIVFAQNTGGSGGFDNNNDVAGNGAIGVLIKDSSDFQVTHNIVFDTNRGGTGGGDNSSTVEYAGQGGAGVDIGGSISLEASNDIVCVNNTGGDGGQSPNFPGTGAIGIICRSCQIQTSHSIFLEDNIGGQGQSGDFDSSGGNGITISGTSLQACDSILFQYNIGGPGGGIAGMGGCGVEVVSGSSLQASNNISFTHNQSGVQGAIAGVGVLNDCSAQLQCSHLNYQVDCSSNSEGISGEPTSGSGLFGFYDGEPAIVHKQNVGCTITACP